MPRDQAKDHHDHGNDKQQVDESSSDAEDQAQQPKSQQYGSNQE